MFKTKPTFIAEISCNHNGSIKNAKKLILEAKKAGADFVKLQTYTADTMTIKSNLKDFIIKKGIWKNQNLWDLYNEAETPFEWQKNLFDFAKKIKIKCFSTPFDETAVDLLEKLNCPLYKIASFEMNHLPLIKKVAKTNKPIIISTGTATIKEIDEAYSTAKKNGCSNITLLYCVSSYPAKPDDFNLNNIQIMKKRYNCRVGLSDHSKGNDIAKLAIAAGADVIEKHIKLPNQKKGFDVKFSADRHEIKKLISEIKIIHKYLGKNFFYRSKNEKSSNQFKRSVYTVRDIKKGQKITKKNTKIIRPGFGIQPKFFVKILNKKSPFNYRAGMPIKNDLLKRLRIKIT
jgi:pseudaminic acid synthase